MRTYLVVLALAGILIAVSAVAVAAPDAGPSPDAAAAVIDAGPVSGGSMTDIGGKLDDVREAISELRKPSADKPSSLRWGAAVGAALWLLIAVGKNKLLGDRSKWIPVVVAVLAVPATFLTAYGTGIGPGAAAEIVVTSGTVAVFIEQTRKAFKK